MMEQLSWNYVFIRTCIFFLHLIAPVSVIYSLLSATVRLPIQPPRILRVWLALEAIFYLLVFLPGREYLQRAAKHPAPPCRDDRRALFHRCHSNIPEPNEYLRRWFRNAPEAEIKRENVKEFFCWAFLNTGDAGEAYDGELDEYIREMEKLLGRKLEPGRGNARCIRLTLEKVEMLHRSLTWYLCVFVVDTLASVYLMYHSFNFHRTSFSGFLSVFPLRPLTLFATSCSPARRLTYWHRPHTSKTRLPVLFVHGIGVGLYPYIDFLAEINAEDSKHADDGQVGIIAIEIMSVSSRITFEAMLRDEMCNEVAWLLKSHGWERFVLVSHSYGSVVAAHLLQSEHIAEKIGPVFFVDPVSFLLHLPDVAHNFICRKPKSANEYLLSYFGSKDMGVSHTLFRRFFWADNVLWKEDVQDRRLGIALAGRDIVVDTKSIGAYLLGSEAWASKTAGWADATWKCSGVDMLWFGDLDHGEAFSNKCTRRKLVRMVREFCDESSL